jgi:hypothetical protein
MQIHILEEAGQELAAVDSVVRRRELEVRRTQAVKQIERLYLSRGGPSMRPCGTSLVPLGSGST